MLMVNRFGGGTFLMRREREGKTPGETESKKSDSRSIG